MDLEDRIYEENIVLNLKASTREEVIQKLAELLWNNGFIRNVHEFVNDVAERESQMTTGVGNGLAIPRGKSNSVLESTVVFAKVDQAIEWNSLDEEPVKLIFLLAIANEDEGNEHLRLLADISEKLMDEAFVESIREADSAKEIKALLAFKN